LSGPRLPNETVYLLERFGLTGSRPATPKRRGGLFGSPNRGFQIPKLSCSLFRSHQRLKPG
jgi:hypothetical protein